METAKGVSTKKQQRAFKTFCPTLFRGPKGDDLSVLITYKALTVGTRPVRRSSVITPAQTELTGCFSGRSGRVRTVPVAGWSGGPT